jgi:RND family efflux transporter MFP subunit
MRWLANLWRRRRWAVVALAVVCIGMGTLVAARLARSTPSVPLAEVATGEFVDHLPLRGELKALRSVVLVAPASAGELQILKLAKNGAAVKKGELVIEFDSTNVQRLLQQRETELRQAESEIDRIKAQGKMVAEQNQTDLIKAQYDVERARLEASKQEILSEIEGAKTKLNLANAVKKLQEVEQKLKSDQTSNAADLEARMQRRDKSQFDLRDAQRRLAALTVLAPSDGVVNVLDNWRMGGPMIDPPPFKEGDRAWPGAEVAELPDISTIRMSARIEEADRGRIQLEQVAMVRVDAIPEKEFSAKVSAISPMAKPDFSNWPPVRNFDVEVQLDELDPRLRPGMSANARIAVEKLPNSMMIPAEAVFQKGGRTVAYVLRGSEFEEREVVVLRRSGAQVAIARGLKPGERVARRDPTLEETLK